MPGYYVEGLFANEQAVKKKRKTGVFPPGVIEPYARTIWANSPREAILIATEELKGGEWMEGPKVSQTSEEQRMRSMGAPELPGFELNPTSRYTPGASPILPKTKKDLRKEKNPLPTSPKQKRNLGTHKNSPSKKRGLGVGKPPVRKKKG